MTDLSVVLELILMLCAPAAPIAAGVLLRRKAAARAAADGSPQGGSGALRLTGTLLVWAGAIAYLLMGIFALNFKGVI